MPKAKNHSITRDVELHFLAGEFHLQRACASGIPLDEVELFFAARNVQRQLAAKVLAIHPLTESGRLARRRVEFALLEDGAHPLVGDR